MKIIITGVAGFIGSHLGEKLISLGQEVIGIDNFDPFYPKKFKENNLAVLQASDKFSFYEADIRNKQSIKDIFNASPTSPSARSVRPTMSASSSAACSRRL